jgi:hypothetical protein
MSADSAIKNSVIHDIGYQRYDGPRLGRGYAARSLFTHGLRVAFGLGRSAKAKIFPWIIIGMVSAIALIVAVTRAQGGARVVQERCVIADCREPDGTWNDKHAPVDCRAGGPFHSKDADAGRWFGCNRIPREHARGTQCLPIPCTVLAGDRLPVVKERR